MLILHTYEKPHDADNADKISENDSHYQIVDKPVHNVWITTVRRMIENNSYT